MKESGKLHMFLLLLTGILTSVMIAMMWVGGSINFGEFLSVGNVYDISPEILKESSSKWIYDEQEQGYWLLNNKASKRLQLNGQEQSWNYLYLTIRELSVDSLSGIVKYYGKEKKKRYEQPIELHEGVNVILLNEEVPMTRIRFTFLKAKGEFVAISQMQFRTRPRCFPSDFLKCFMVVFAGVMVFLIILLYLKHRLVKVKKKHYVSDVLFGGMQDVIRVLGDALGSRSGGRLYPYQQESVRKFLFSTLIVWMMLGSALGWLNNVEAYRYHVLVCALLLFAVSFVSWEKPLQNQSWNGVIMKSWLGLWLGVLLCDCFVERKLESMAGCAMFLAGSVFIFFWQNMERPDRLFHDLIEALEITFFLGVVYCMLFRAKLPAIDYNGMFRKPEDLAMYGVLMAVVFLSDMDGMLNDRIADVVTGHVDHTGEGMFTACVKNIAGGALALFLVLRSNHMVGIMIFIFLSIIYFPILAVKLFRMKGRKMLFVHIMTAVIIAYACVSAVFISIKYVPVILDMNVTYETNLHLTELQGSEKEMFLLANPGSLDDVRTKEVEKLPIIWSNYVRRLNLFGHSGTREVFQRYIKPHNSYLDMAYHHGIFILLPYVLLQIATVGAGIKCAFQKKGRRTIFFLFLGIAYICFSFIANVESSWVHPMWLCYYLSAGYTAKKDEIEENLGKEGLT